MGTILLSTCFLKNTEWGVCEGCGFCKKNNVTVGAMRETIQNYGERLSRLDLAQALRELALGM